MSHPIHADNCQYQDNASCPVLILDFRWRDFSAAVYLNDDAHGGELVFATTPRTSVRVRELQSDAAHKCRIFFYIQASYHMRVTGLLKT
ncbi:hypothetical protein MTO96_041650 [Rhipicephalus appendiculatus]